MAPATAQRGGAVAQPRRAMSLEEVREQEPQGIMDVADQTHPPKTSPHEAQQELQVSEQAVVVQEQQGHDSPCTLQMIPLLGVPMSSR